MRVRGGGGWGRRKGWGKMETTVLERQLKNETTTTKKNEGLK